MGWLLFLLFVIAAVSAVGEWFRRRRRLRARADTLALRRVEAIAQAWRGHG